MYASLAACVTRVPQRLEFLRGRQLTLGSLMEKLAELHGDAHLATEDGEDGLELTYLQAADLVARTAGSIQKRISPGDRVVVGTPNGYGLFLLTLAVARAGGVAVPVNPKTRPDEIDHIVADSGARFVVRSFEDEIGADPVAAVAASPDDVAAIFYSSGTTGRPKGAQLTNRALVHQAGTAAAFSVFRSPTEVVSGMPVAHIAGYSMLAQLASLRLPIYLLRRFRPDAALDAIEFRQAGMFIGVPAMYRMMLEAGAAERDLSSVRVWASGADVMPVELARRFQSMGSLLRVPGTRRRIGGAVYIEAYGMVELGGGVALKVLPPLPVLPFPGLVGLPMPGYRMRVVNEEDQDVGRKEVGELVVRGPGVMRGYRGQHDPQETFTSDGWLRTGDLARYHRCRMVEFVGRKKDVIKHGGYSVFAVEVEAVLDQHPAVAESAVVGLADTTKGEVPAAVVRAVPGVEADQEGLIRWATERLADYKVPRRIMFVNELPRGGTDKVQKGELKRMFAPSAEALA